MFKKIISLTLVVCLLSVMLSAMTVSAAATFGSCGPKMSWRIDKGVLSITGSGTMLDYGKIDNAPWYGARLNVVEIIIESGIENIGDYAFFGCNKVAKVSIPETVVSIGDFAFTSCKTLENITLPNALKDIGSNAFKDCSSLKAVNIPTGVNYIGSDAFSGCSDLESVVLPRTITTIEPRTFSGCSILATILIPDGVTKICQEAFSGCGYLKTVSFGYGIQTIETGAFNKCDKLSDVKYSGNSATWNTVSIGANNETLKMAHVVFASTASADDDTIMVYLNGEKLTFDQPPVIIDGRTLVPLRAIFEALGAEVFWDDATKTVTAKKGYKIISLEIGKKAILIDSVAKGLDVPAQIINSRTLVPVRAISEAFGCDVGWDAVTQTVIITEK